MPWAVRVLRSRGVADYRDGTGGNIAVAGLCGTAGLPDRAVTRRLSQLGLRLSREAEAADGGRLP